MILGRFLFLAEEEAALKIPKGLVPKAITRIANEIETCWINFNVYPMTRAAIHKKITDFIENFRYVRKFCNDPTKSKQPKFQLCCQNVLASLKQPGFDIRTQDKNRVNQLEIKYSIKMTEEDEKFLEDNICGERKMSAKLDQNWVRKKREEERKTEKRELKRKRISEELEKQRSLYDKQSFVYSHSDIDQEEKSSDEE